MPKTALLRIAATKDAEPCFFLSRFGFHSTIARHWKCRASTARRISKKAVPIEQSPPVFSARLPLLRQPACCSRYRADAAKPRSADFCRACRSYILFA